MFNPANKLKNLGLSVSGNLPSELAGTWILHNPGPSDSPAFQFVSDGRHFISLLPEPYVFSNNGQVLNIGNGAVVLNRQSGLVPGFDGHWINVNINEPDYLFDNGSAYEFDKDGRVYVLNYKLSPPSVPPTITFWPWRSTVTVSGNVIKYHPIYWTESGEIEFSLQGDELTLILSDGSQLIYDRQ